MLTMARPTGITDVEILAVRLFTVFLPRDASAKGGDATVIRLSVCP